MKINVVETLKKIKPYGLCTKYTKEQMADVLESVNNIGMNKTSRLFNISKSTIRNWKDPDRNKRYSKIQYERKKSCVNTLKKPHLTKVVKTNFKQIKQKKQVHPIQTPQNLNNHIKGYKNSIITKDYLSAAYTPEECQKEYDMYRSKEGSYGKIPSSNKIILTYQPHYYEKENKLWNENKNDIRRKLLNNRLKYIQKDEYIITDREILRGFKISGIYIGYSHFNPLWIKKFIKDYNIQSLYDPCGGWGHRLIGSGDIKYIYNDLDKRTYESCKKICKDFQMKNKIFYNNDCRNFTPSEEYECIFTCPPYYNTETYQNKTFKDLNDYKNWWKKTINNSLKKSVKYFSFVINNDFKNILIRECLNKGMILHDEISLGLKYNHFQSLHKKYKGEYLYIFKCI
jgi:hypothetical protein